MFEGSKTAKEAQAAEKEAMLKTIGLLILERDYLMEDAHKKDYKVSLRRET